MRLCLLPLFSSQRLFSLDKKGASNRGGSYGLPSFLPSSLSPPLPDHARARAAASASSLLKLRVWRRGHALLVFGFAVTPCAYCVPFLPFRVDLFLSAVIRLTFSRWRVVQMGSCRRRRHAALTTNSHSTDLLCSPCRRRRTP